jgi:hypothetical protein
MSDGIKTIPCHICGALVYLELMWDDSAESSGIPMDTRRQHAEWHERTGTA